ncbi:MAG: hypothetical protein KBC84_01345 [Proteobacteria bacterium]|nr:hypothetical protein [Pseudomonadota bacterium]
MEGLTKRVKVMQKSSHKKQIFPWSSKTKQILQRLNCPFEIQNFLDKCRYNKSDKVRSPEEVATGRIAHCFDGAVFAASVLNYFGEQPLILDLCAVRDDDHILAIYKRGRYFGSIAKSNYSGLRFREAIFKSERELVLSYFEAYYNLQGEKTLRTYSNVFNLFKITKIDWQKTTETFECIASALNRTRHYKLFPPSSEMKLSPMDARSFRVGLVGAV